MAPSRVRRRVVRALRRARRANPLHFEFELPALASEDVRQGF